MKCKVIGCEIFRWMIKEELFPQYDFTFIAVAQHNHPQQLHQKLQAEINAAQEYEAIILLYGLCGNAIVNLKSTHTPIYVFRAHDCAAILLGSNGRYAKYFQNQKVQEWTCCTLLQNNQVNSIQGLKTFADYEKEYGEHAQYLWDLLKPSTAMRYITFHQEEDEVALHQCRKEGKEIIEIIEGSTLLVNKMLNLENDKMICLIEKEYSIHALYDLEEVIEGKL